MADHLTQDTLLENPGKVGDLLTKMMDGDEDGLTVTEAELGEIKEDMKDRRDAARGSHSTLKGETFIPRGEGGSGQAKIPGLDVQTASVIDHDDEQGGSDEDSQFYDPDSTNDQNHSGAGSAPLLISGNVTSEDFELLIDSVNTMIKEEISKLEKRVVVEVGKLNLEIGALQKKVTSLSSRVTSLSVKVNERPPALPITSAGPSAPPKTVQAPPATPAKADKGKGKGQDHTRKSPSITDIPGSGPRVATVIGYLAKNPTYPKSALARKLRLQQLANELGFNVPSKEVLPGDWNADGLLKLFA